MAMTTRMMIYAFLLYGGIFAAIVAVIARVIKYLIRYGIDYYFEKLAQNQKHKDELNYESDHHPLCHRKRCLL